MMDRKEQKKYITELLMPLSELKHESFVSISKITVAAERQDMLRKIIRDLDIWNEKFGYYKKDIYVFNGRYFERTYYDVLEYALEYWLDSLGVRALDRAKKQLFVYMGCVMSRIRDRALKPDLSLMCFQNGVVDMHKLKLMPFSPSLDVLKQYGFKYDRKEIFNCPVWRSFLGETYLPNVEVDGVLPEKEKRRVLQMFLGACLLNRADISFEYFMILQGTGANGKSVIYRVLRDLFGEDEIANISMSQFARSGDEALRAGFSLDGKRIMYCPESKKSDFKDMSVIKSLSSGEPVACRGIGENITMMRKPPLLMWNSNFDWEKTDFANRDNPEDISIQRRAIIVNFEKTIPVDKRDTMLAEKLKAEQAGIFAWMVKGLCELKKNGFRMPDIVASQIDRTIGSLSESKKIRVDGDEVKVSNSVLQYLRCKRCRNNDREGGVRVYLPIQDLYQNYVSFIGNIGRISVLPVSDKKFARDLNALGYSNRADKDNRNRKSYTLYCLNDRIAEHFLENVPNLTDEVSLNVFEGEELTDEEFLNEDNDK